MKTALKFLILMAMIYLIGLIGSAQAEKGDAQSQQQEMKQMMDMLKNSGMDPKQMQQMQDMFKSMEGQVRRQSSVRLKKEQQKFEAETVGHGTAQVELNGKQYDLTMTRCKIIDRSTGHFTMSARQAPVNGNVSLDVKGGGGHSGNTVGLMLGKGDPYEAFGIPTFQLNGKTMQWEGEVTRTNKEKVSLKFNLTCGAEMVDYATPTKAKPEADVNVLTLQIGKEAHTFEAGRCSTQEYRTGNLIVEFEATATGTFRGRPAIILLSKSHPAESTGAKQTFQNMDLLLGELTPEQTILSPLKVAEQLRNKAQEFSNKENASIQKKYKEKMKAFQKQFDTEMPALKKQYGGNIPQDKMTELMDPMNKLMDAQNKEMDEVREQVKAMRYPKSRSFGAITVKGQEVHFGGSKLSPTHNREAPEFQNLPEKTELWVTCGK